MARWRQDIIREFLARAEASGRETIVTRSTYDAEKLRFAIYNFRRAEGVGMSLTISVNGKNVTATLMPQMALVNTSSEQL